MTCRFSGLTRAPRLEVTMPSKSLALLAGLIFVVAVVAAPAALADQVFHTSHAPAHSVVAAPLQSGFVTDIHTNGTVNAAREEYHLNGAQPNTTYQVQLVIYGDQSCAGSPFATVPTAMLTTNVAGNGNANTTFAAGPPNNPPLAVGIVWQFTANGAPVYATDCVPVSID
jgi:hypothetical protein